jgi:hypothetical protein
VIEDEDKNILKCYLTKDGWMTQPPAGQTLVIEYTETIAPDGSGLLPETNVKQLVEVSEDVLRTLFNRFGDKPSIDRSNYVFFLDVPKAEAEEVRQLGAKWDSLEKQFYIDLAEIEHIDFFKRWIPGADYEE